MATLTITQLAALKSAISDIGDRQSAPNNKDLSYRETQKLEFDKWRLIQKYIHSTPPKTRHTISRSRQWGEAAAQIRHLGVIEVLDWALLQSQIARNLERGIQDMRPRKNGPCDDLLLEYVGDRKRKAHAILNFAIASETKGTYVVNSRFHEKTEEILTASSKTYKAHDEGHESLPWRTRSEPNED